MRRILVCLPPLLFGCAEQAPCDPTALAPGEAEALVDNQLWQGEGAQWMPAGDGIQIVTEMADGWRLTLVANRIDGDRAVGDYLESVPLEINLSGDDGFAIAYKEFANSMTSRDSSAGGLLDLLDVYEDGSMGACFSFSAEGPGGGNVTFSDGAIRAAEGMINND